MILEIVAGNFLTSESIAKEFPKCSVTVMELSSENDYAPSTHNLNTITGNFEDMLFSAKYDLIFSNQVLDGSIN